MTMQRYFLEGFGSDEELASLKESPAFPLIRELEFKFGLKVLRLCPIRTDYGAQGAYQLCNKFGIAIAKAWACKNNDGKMEYNYRSPYYKKERGSSQDDKETMRSVKISSLIATLTRHEVVPTHATVADKTVAKSKSAMSLMKNSLGKGEKYSGHLSSQEIHAMLASILGKQGDRAELSIDLDKCKNIFDIYEEADRIRDMKVEEMKRMFSNPFYMIGVDELQHFIIGKFKATTVDANNDKYTYETVEPFKRYAKLEDYPELVPLMTMVKVAYEEAPSKHGIFPLTDRYDSNLDMTFFYDTRPTHYECLWMTTSC